MSETQHADHGGSPARWWGVSLSAVGWTVGGPAFFLGDWPLVALGAALQVAALAVALVLNAAGFGRPDRWNELKAKAAAERGTI